MYDTNAANDAAAASGVASAYDVWKSDFGAPAHGHTRAIDVSNHTTRSSQSVGLHGLHSESEKLDLCRLLSWFRLMWFRRKVDKSVNHE